MEYPYVDIGKTKYSSSPSYNDWTLSSTRTLSTIRFRFTSPYNRFLNSKSALSLYINAKESKEIKFIEGLLFLSMIPLHKDNFNRQKMFYIRALELLNETLRDTNRGHVEWKKRSLEYV